MRGHHRWQGRLPCSCPCAHRCARCGFGIICRTDGAAMRRKHCTGGRSSKPFGGIFRRSAVSQSWRITTLLGAQQMLRSRCDNARLHCWNAWGTSPTKPSAPRPSLRSTLCLFPAIRPSSTPATLLYGTKSLDEWMPHPPPRMRASMLTKLVCEERPWASQSPWS